MQVMILKFFRALTKKCRYVKSGKKNGQNVASFHIKRTLWQYRQEFSRGWRQIGQEIGRDKLVIGVMLPKFADRYKKVNKSAESNHCT